MTSCSASLHKMESIDIACKDAVNGMPSRRPVDLASICIDGVKNMTIAWINMHPFPTAKLMALEANMTFF
ncbi:hypothetical protein C4D60_Mb04t38700 [Musa balbisiana]|uniref:Uncharacterized protein n=1 Tax=Musa balbisiana TaxID=52838 RepID=A0A4S8KHS1_MUSBA|nr:hypothetical protein C4D60_Mb04t38700 [Musa balbisiana]